MVHPFRKAFTTLCVSACLLADEGMWTFNQFPRELVKQRYGVDVSDVFLDQLARSSVRLNSGGSGSFVSPKGLVFTNHHVAAECVQKLSSKSDDLMKNGFHARTLAEERACPDLEVNQLLRMSNVTDRVKSGGGDTGAPAAVSKIRRANIAAIEKECAAQTKNRCDVVTLYAGGRYDLYEYKRFTDIRLVFAPEFEIAFFGGDPDNFEYPRWNLDIAFFRAYENGQPADTSKNYLRWSPTGAKDGELLFVSGHPGTTQRLATIAQLEFARDVVLPITVRRLSTMMQALMAYGSRGPEQMRQRNDLYFSFANSFKASNGFLGGLRDPNLMETKRQAEGKLRDAVMSDAARRASYGDAWERIAAAFTEARRFYSPYQAYEMHAVGGSELLYFARILIRMAEEDKKPNGERLKEYTEAMRPEVEQTLFSTAPIYPELEAAVIEENLRFLSTELGAEDKIVAKLLNGKSPKEAAKAIIESTKLADVAERKRLAKDPAALAALTTDGAIEYVRALDKEARELRKRWEDSVGAVLSANAPRIAQARYEVSGPGEYPDATFTLRLTFGKIGGYKAKDGKPVSWATDFAGMYRHATGKEPYRLPDSILRARRKLNLKTPFNFVATADIHGGNSGSPTVNAKGEIIGIVFDGNIESLPNRYLYEDARSRSVHVASQGIVEALRKVYGATALLTELGQ